MSEPYDQSHNERPRDVLTAHVLRPFKRAVDVARNRVNDLRRRMAHPAFLDQYPARTVPYVFSKLYGPFGLVAARRNGAVGFEGRAPVAEAGDFILPRNDIVRVNREGAFYWTATNIAGYYSLTYDADPGLAANPGVISAPVADIFDPVFPNNGGALVVNNFFGNGVRICFDLVLYDKKRGRRLHENSLPPQVLCGQGYANKTNASPIRFDPNTEIEPRLRLLEVRPDDLLDTDQAFDAAQFAGYLSLNFIGYKVLEV